MENNRYIESAYNVQDPQFETPLRPEKLQDFIGQESTKARLNVVMEAAKKRKEALGHLLFCGPCGLGKTTLSHLISKEMQSNLIITSGPTLEKAGDLAGLLTSLRKSDVLFIDEIHRLHKTIEEYLYAAMESFRLDIIIDSGPSARSVQVSLNPFTLIGATTRFGSLSAPMRSRFSSIFRLDHYPQKDLESIVLRSGKLLGLKMHKQTTQYIAKRARGTPRIANNLLKWVRDYAQTKTNTNEIEEKIAEDALEMIGIDHAGLDEMDHRILNVMINNYKGGPIGLQTLAIAVGEEPSTLEEVYEPYLILQGLIERTPRGRVATDRAKKHVKNPLNFRS